MNTSRNLWPHAIIAVCALFVASTVGLIVMACSQKMDLVSNDYYEQELKYQGQIDRAERTRREAREASVAYDAADEQITVSLPSEQARRQVSGSIELYRPSAAGLDRAVELKPDANGIQRLDAAGLAPGLWKVRVSWIAEKQSYYLERAVVLRPEPS